MGGTFALTDSIQRRSATRAVIVGAGYIGMEMAEALTHRGLQVTLVEQLPQLLPTVDAELAAHLKAELAEYGVSVHTATTVAGIEVASGELAVTSKAGTRWTADIVLVVTGVQPDTTLAAEAGVTLGVRGAIAVDRAMRTNVPNVLASGDSVHTYPRALAEHVYLPLGTTAHKQGAVAGANAVGGDRRFAGSLGTQVVRVFDYVAAGTGLRDRQAAEAGFDPLTVETVADDHKAYYPEARPIRLRLTGDRRTGRLLGGQLLGAQTSEIAKRLDVLAAAMFHGSTVRTCSSSTCPTPRPSVAPGTPYSTRPGTGSPAGAIPGRWPPCRRPCSLGRGAAVDAPAAPRLVVESTWKREG